MPVERVLLFKFDPGVGSKPTHFIGPAEQPLNLTRERTGITGRHLDPALAISQCFTETAAIREENRKSGGHGFQHYERLPFLLNSRKHKEICGMEQGAFLFTRYLARKRDEGRKLV